MHILAIDTSCDETSAAVVQNTHVLSNVISSQVDLHKKWGGVVPDIARRAHKERIEPVIKEALNRARCTVDNIDYFAATYGPGLAIALEVGLKKAQEIAISSKKPFIPINHMEGHLLSSFARNSRGNSRFAPPDSAFPLIGLLASGGHTEMVYMRAFGKYEIIGETLDDAAGEAFDKVANMLDLGYPGGPIVSEFAHRGRPGRFPLPVPMVGSKDLNFSYSGLKTAALYKLEAIRAEHRGRPVVSWVYDFCADFLDSIIKSLVLKLEMAVDTYQCKGILLGGGVMSNVDIRKRIRSSMRTRSIPVYQPYSHRLFTDNAAMIGIAAHYAAARAVRGDAILEIDRNPVARLGEGI